MATQYRLMVIVLFSIMILKSPVVFAGQQNTHNTFVRQASSLDNTEACRNPANPIVAENCLPGNNDWWIDAVGNIEGFASSTSVNKGTSISFFVNTPNSNFDLLIYRSGYYAGAGARLLKTVTDIAGHAQPNCAYDIGTGLSNCSNWTASYKLDIPEDWVSGNYFAVFVRKDDGGRNYSIFVVRDDERNSDILYQQSVTTFQAYNYYGGKSIYNNSDIWNACVTVTGETRAAKVSFNRPYQAPMSEFNMYFHGEYPLVNWLEQQGYDVTYSTDLDTHNSGKKDAHNELLDHKIFLVSGHDEYWSQEMHDAILGARDAGVNLSFFSSNVSYWRIRFEDDALTGQTDRTMVTYKTAQSGLPDPSGNPTTTWRDPNGVNDPENGLIGQMYIGDNGTLFFPIRVSAEQAKDPIYRNTGLQSIPADSVVNLGERLVGWEWDAVVDNGHTPDNLSILAASPVNGERLLDAGREYSNPIDAISNVTRYKSSSGAYVFSSGTNQWSWGLAIIEPNPRIQQITYNLFADMGVQPSSPSQNLVLDSSLNNSIVEPATDYFFPDKLQAPTITKFEAVAGVDSVTINWDTDIPTRGVVWFGVAPNDTNEFTRVDGDNYSTHHELTESFLHPNRTYYYIISVIDSYGQIITSSVQSFHTQQGGIVDSIREFIRPIAGGLVCTTQTNPAAIILSVVILIAVLFILIWVFYRRRLRLTRTRTVTAES